MAVDMLTEPAIWSATELEQAWHASIAAIWTHNNLCAPCTHAEHSGHRTRCSKGLALREAEQAAWRSTKADMYVPAALS